MKRFSGGGGAATVNASLSSARGKSRGEFAETESIFGPYNLLSQSAVLS
jgi:hypothetical protein